MARESGEKIITVNRKARHDYFIDETVEAGIMLLGAEVKSLRDGKVNLKDSYAKITKGGEAYLVGVYIAPYGYAARDVPEPERQRKLLMHRREIDRLAGKTRERGFTLVPTKLYFKNGVAKVEIGLARGKEHHDKRQDLKAAESKREVDRVMKSRNRTRS
jgi:SsrA-binding protein